MYFHRYLKKINIQTYKWEVLKKLTLKAEHITFLMTRFISKNFDSSLLKIDKKSYKNIDIYYIGYITMKGFDYVNIHSVNPLYFIAGKADGYIEEKMEINT